jgi:hypothetical protein
MASALSAAIVLLKHPEKIVTRGGVGRLEPPVVEDQQLRAAERALDAGIATIAAGEREVSEELGNTLVEDGAIVQTGLCGRALRRANFCRRRGWSAQGQFLMCIDPGALGKAAPSHQS